MDLSRSPTRIMVCSLIMGRPPHSLYTTTSSLSTTTALNRQPEISVLRLKFRKSRKKLPTRSDLLLLISTSTARQRSFTAMQSRISPSMLSGSAAVRLKWISAQQIRASRQLLSRLPELQTHDRDLGLALQCGCCAQG